MNINSKLIKSTCHFIEEEEMKSLTSIDMIHRDQLLHCRIWRLGSVPWLQLVEHNQWHKVQQLLQKSEIIKINRWVIYWINKAHFWILIEEVMQLSIFSWVRDLKKNISFHHIFYCFKLQRMKNRSCSISRKN